jgi:hypothetical protein
MTEHTNATGSPNASQRDGNFIHPPLLQPPIFTENKSKHRDAILLKPSFVSILPKDPTPLRASAVLLGTDCIPVRHPDNRFVRG